MARYSTSAWRRSRRWPAQTPAQPSTEQHLTSPGSAMGTVAYMSPEQALGKDLDGRADLFSFGAVLYEMATGTLPFRGDTTAAIFNAILSKPTTPALRVNPDLTTPSWSASSTRPWKKTCDLRYQNASEMRSDFKRLKRETESGRSASAVAAGAPAAAFRLAGIAIPVAAVIILVIAFFWLRSPVAPPRVLSVTQLTSDNRYKGGIVTDGRGFILRRIKAGELSSAKSPPVAGRSDRFLLHSRTPGFWMRHPPGQNCWSLPIPEKEGSSLAGRLPYGSYPCPLVRRAGWVISMAPGPPGRQMANNWSTPPATIST